MLKKIFYISGTLLLIVSIVWEYKVNILIWTIPTLMNIANPVQENIPTNWSSGPSEIQKITDSFTKKVDELVAVKETDIMKV